MTCKECKQEMNLILDEPFGQLWECYTCNATAEVYFNRDDMKLSPLQVNGQIIHD